MTLYRKPFENTVEKEENAGNQHFLPFPTMFSTLPITNFHFSVTFILSCRLQMLLTLSQTSPGFYKSLENTVGKGEIAHNEQFLLFPHCFLTFWKTFRYGYQVSNFHLQTLSIRKSKKSVVCKCCQFGPVYNFVVLQRVNSFSIYFQDNKTVQRQTIYRKKIFMFVCTKESVSSISMVAQNE